ncbi:putative HTH-type transcriptional regulator YdfH [Oceanibacterium hippocampi]|uniref:Putative HTH-type transcriptional regulator YdfH n=2 Tax=Oceanibacterium hippocampi TaxID=745714 RepID=A0A1Y5TLI6_9PROT|nr:putative HTH-type transcriptional regulator YdfH [Oceanibacterium hippocampi]
MCALNVTRETLHLKCKEAITTLILNGEFSPGERLVEARLGEMLGLSRTTVRSALQQLVQEGLVLQESFRGVIVRPITAESAHETATLREALEVLAVRRAALKITDQEIGELRGRFNDLLESTATRDAAVIFRNDVALHKLIVRIAKHGLLSTHYAMIESQVLFYMAHVGAGFMEREALSRQHKSMVEAICDHDPEEAERALHLHFEEGTGFLIHLLEKMNLRSRKAASQDGEDEIVWPWAKRTDAD